MVKIELSLSPGTINFFGGFFHGFVDSLKSDKNTFSSPVSSLVFATVNGGVYGVATNLVGTFIPGVMYLNATPGALMASSVFVKHPDLLTSLFDEAKEGAQAGIDNIRQNGLKEITHASQVAANVGNETFERIASTDVVDKFEGAFKTSMELVKKS